MATLEAWAAQREAKRKQSALDTPLQTPSLKEQGNAAFKAGDFARAIELYSASLQQEETVECLTNRALAHIKLQHFALAVDDCTRALVKHPANAKAFARRAQARSLMGAHDVALVDYTRACELEPGNSALQKERAREQAMVDALGAVPARSKPHTRTKVVEMDSEPKSTAPTQRVERAAAKSKPAAAAMDAVTAAALRLADSAVALPAAAPTSLYAFEKTWRDLAPNPALRTELLVRVMSDADFKACFAKSLEPELLLDIVRALPTGDDARRIVRSLQSLPSFEFTAQFLTASNRALLDQQRCSQ